MTVDEQDVRRLIEELPRVPTCVRCGEPSADGGFATTAVGIEEWICAVCCERSTKLFIDQFKAAFRYIENCQRGYRR